MDMYTEDKAKELKKIIINGAFPESHLSSTLVVDLESTLDKIDDFFESENIEKLKTKAILRDTNTYIENGKKVNK